MDAPADAGPGGHLADALDVRRVVDAEEEEVRVRDDGHRRDQGLAAAIERGGAEVEDEGSLRAEAELGAQARRLEGAIGFGRVGQVADHHRPALEAIVLPEAIGDPVGDGDHRVAAADRQPLERRDQLPPERLAVRHPERELVRVVDQPGAGQPGADRPGAEHRRVMGVDRIRAQLPQGEEEREEEHGPVGDGRQPAAHPGRRRHRADPEALELAVELSRPARQVEDGHLVAGARQGARRPADPRVVLDRLVEQHRDPHQRPRIEAQTRKGARALPQR